MGVGSQRHAPAALTPGKKSGTHCTEWGRGGSPGPPWKGETRNGVLRKQEYLMWSRDSSVGIATRYGLHCSGIDSRLGRDFPHPFRPALRPTQPPIQWVPGLSRG